MSSSRANLMIPISTTLSVSSWNRSPIRLLVGYLVALKMMVVKLSLMISPLSPITLQKSIHVSLSKKALITRTSSSLLTTSTPKSLKRSTLP